MYCTVLYCCTVQYCTFPQYCTVQTSYLSSGDWRCTVSLRDFSETVKGARVSGRGSRVWPIQARCAAYACHSASASYLTCVGCILIQSLSLTDGGLLPCVLCTDCFLLVWLCCVCCFVCLQCCWPCTVFTASRARLRCVRMSMSICACCMLSPSPWFITFLLSVLCVLSMHIM